MKSIYWKYCLTIAILLMVTYSCKVLDENILIDKRDGKEYPVIKIGNRYWMGANLAFLPYVYPSASDSGIYVYGYEGRDITEAVKTIQYQTYGVLYNWAVAMDLPLEANMRFSPNTENNHRGICPPDGGWHLPTTEEVQEMENSLETFPDFQTDDNRRHTGDVGKKLKSTYGWFEEGNGTNETGFCALPSGIRYQDGYFDKIGKYGYFWTSTEIYPQSAYYRFIVYNSDGTYSGYPDKKIGMPVRCLKY